MIKGSTLCVNDFLPFLKVTICYTVYDLSGCLACYLCVGRDSVICQGDRSRTKYEVHLYVTE